MNALAGDRPLSDIELEEKFASKSLDRGVTHRLLPLLRPVRTQVAAVIGIELVQVLAIFARPLLIGLVIDRALKPFDAALVVWACVGLAVTCIHCHQNWPTGVPACPVIAPFASTTFSIPVILPCA